MNTYFPTPLDSECLKVFSYKQTNMFFLINLCPLKNNKSRPKGRHVVFGRGRKIIFAPLRSLHSFAIAHRRTPVRLSLVVELSCRVQIFAPLKNNKSRPKGRLVVFGRGRKIRTLDTRFWRPMLYQLSYTPNFRNCL